MAIKPVTLTPQTDSQKLYQKFWRQFNAYSAQDKLFCAQFTPHPYADVKYYQDYSVSMGPYHLCCGINFKRHECKVEAFFRDVVAWDIYFDRYRERIETQIGEHLIWKKLQANGTASLVRVLDFNESQGWDKVFKQSISDLLLFKQVFAKFYNMAEMRKFWIFPSNENDFRLHDFFKDNSYIDWTNKNNNSFNVGDIVFIYCSHPESTIRHITEVIRINVPVSEAIDVSSYSLKPLSSKIYEYYTRLKHLKDIHYEELNYEALLKHGLKGSIMLPQKPNSELLSYILSVVGEISLDQEQISI